MKKDNRLRKKEDFLLVPPRIPGTISRENRRLDSLARLLEGKSTCAAVCFIRGEFLIATNSIKHNRITNMREDSKQLSLITDIMGYFSTLANHPEGINEQKIQKIRKKLFKKICKQYVNGQ